jgi:pimeloyl-ACP methyl ester carboxylesterase
MKSIVKIILGTSLIMIMTFCFSSTGPGTVISEDDVEIHYTVYGKSGPLLVLVHCWCCDQTYWENQVDMLAEKNRVVTIDLAGHGLSGTNRQEWAMEKYANDVVAVVRQLKPDKIILVGHSMGGFVSLYAALQLEDLLAGIILVDSLHDIWWPIPDSMLNEALQPYLDDFQQHTYNYVSDLLFPPTADSAIRERVARDMASAPPEIGTGSIVNMWGGDYSGLMENINRLDIPVWLMNIEMFPTNYKAMDSLGFQVVSLPGVGHFPMLEKPEVFNKLFLGTLMEIDN